MWTRRQLKENAKEVLSKYYWTAFAVSLVVSLLVGGTGMGGGGYTSSSYGSSFDQMLSNGDEIDLTSGEIAALLLVFGIILGVELIIFLIGSALKIFVFNPLIVGEKAYFIRQREDCGKFSNLAICFKKGKYKGSVLVMFLKDLYIFLWSLLLIIPGIIKTYSYFMVPYIAADNPELPADRIFEISKKTMDGEKWNVFVLQLSFILWNLAGLAACCIGVYFVVPYIETTNAELYAYLKSKALREGIIAEGELPRSIWNDPYATTYGSNTGSAFE